MKKSVLTDGVMSPEPLLPDLSARSPPNPCSVMKGTPRKYPAPFSSWSCGSSIHLRDLSSVASSALRLLHRPLSCLSHSFSGG